MTVWRTRSPYDANREIDETCYTRKRDDYVVWARTRKLYEGRGAETKSLRPWNQLLSEKIVNLMEKMQKSNKRDK